MAGLSARPAGPRLVAAPQHLPGCWIHPAPALWCAQLGVGRASSFRDCDRPGSGLGAEIGVASRGCMRCIVQAEALPNRRCLSASSRDAAQLNPRRSAWLQRRQRGCLQPHPCAGLLARDTLASACLGRLALASSARKCAQRRGHAARARRSVGGLRSARHEARGRRLRSASMSLAARRVCCRRARPQRRRSR